jgi:two-component system OmpR family response regulator
LEVPFVSQVPPSILVVDDDPSIRRLVADVLETEGYAVRAVDDGFAALRSVEEDEPDCVVLDVMMPGLDGHEVLRALRGRHSDNHVPVIMLTAAAEDEEIWRSWSAGVDYFLTKPFGPDELLRFLRYLFQTAGQAAYEQHTA